MVFASEEDERQSTMPSPAPNDAAWATIKAVAEANGLTTLDGSEAPQTGNPSEHALRIGSLHCLNTTASH